MRSHAKASTAGSTQRQASGLGRFFRGALATRGALLTSKGSGAPKVAGLALGLCAALVLALALAAVPAAGSQGHYMKEVFGASAQPTLTEARDIAIDQSTGDLLVMEATEPTLGNPTQIKRFNPDGTPDSFSALGTNAIDGKEGADATPQGGLSFASQSESQIAVDNSGTATAGNIYVTRSSPRAIDVFSDTGAYLGQLTAAGATSFTRACGVAVDATGALYVGDHSAGIKKFVPAGAFPVNADHTATFTTTTQPCTLAAGAGPTAGFLFPAQLSGPVSKIDATTGELKYTVAPGSHVTVAVDPGSGRVFAAASSRIIEEFDASGAASATQLSATKVFENIRALDVRGASGEIYLFGEQLTFAQFRAEVYDDPIATIPDLTTTAATNNTGTHVTLNGTVNPDGVELDQCRFEYTQSNKPNTSFIEYDHTVPCAETPAAIGSGTSPVAVHADISNLTPQGTHYVFRIAAKNPATTLVKATNQLNFETADTVFATPASDVTDTSATLNGTVNPDGVAMTECLFEWGLTTNYGNTAPCVPNPAGIGTGTSPVAVSAAISDLHPGTTYHYRLKAANADGPIAPAADMSLQTTGPQVLDTWAEDVLVTEANLKAEIDPEGQATTFHFEYGTTEAYGQQTPELNVGSDSSVHTVLASLKELQPGTTYHYRVVATNADGTNEGPDRTIRTFRPFTPETDCPNQANRYGAGASLPDCRGYEMVSPVDKNNGDIRVLGSSETSYPARITKSTSSGERITYSSYRAFADALSAPYTSQYIAQRVAGEGWETHSINAPREEPIVHNALLQFFPEYAAFSDDLCQGWMINFNEPPLAEGALAGYRSLYRRDDRLCGIESFEALAPIAPPGPPPVAEGTFRPFFQGATPDGSHTIFVSNSKLAPEGTDSTRQLYESVEPGAPPRLVCMLPNDEPYTGACQAGSGELNQRPRANLQGAISEDGERIFWNDNISFGGTGKLYVRIGGTETLPVSQPGESLAGTTNSFFWGAALDGSRAVYTTGGAPNSHLFAFDVDAEATEPIAEGVYGVMGMSEDARRVYFVSDKALDGAAIAGQPNLYFYDADQGSGTTTYIATLTSQDFGESREGLVGKDPVRRTSRVTPDGLHAAFTSFAPLTGYDNEDLTTGISEAQGFVYDAVSEELICASCNPSGARDHQFLGKGDPESGPESLRVIPGFDSGLHATRALSEDGSRLFFNSAASLTPRDSNGLTDVYQWEAEGAGGCDAGDSGFAPSAGGCIELISSGRSVFSSKFVEASADGEDVFINTLSGLVPQDYGLRDIYDARVGGGFPLPPEAPECVGDACQSIPAPPNDPTPASAGFKGAGDPAPRKAKRRCRARNRKGAKQSKAKQKKAKRCRRNNRRAGR